MRVAVAGPDLAVRTCARRLAPIGASPAPPLTGGPGNASELALVLNGGGTAAGTGADELEVSLSWYGGRGRPEEAPGSEAVVQALSGLMQVHGRDYGRPRRLGLEVASVAAGILAGHAIVASLIGQRRGRPVASVIESSALQAGLLLVSHRVAAATTGEEWIPAPPGPAPGPPFRSADGQWFEIETLDPETWKTFWTGLGAGRANLGWAWKLFRSRFFRGTVSLPPGLHEAVRRHCFGEVAEVARSCGVSLCRIRRYPEVLEDLGAWAGHPVLRPTAEDHDDGHRAGLPRTSGEENDLPLAGMRVVEATSRLQGPLAGMLVQMLGAEVVRVEPPGGDPARGVPPLAGENGSFFLCFNRGKKPVELDLARPAGRSELEELVSEADVFLHNWRPGKAEEWGLDAASLASVNDRLVYAAASGWGGSRDDGLVGTDFLVQAHSGLAAGLTPMGQPPMPSRALLTDYFGALVTTEGVLAGLYRRETTGRGCRVETSLLAGAMAIQAHVLEALAAGREVGREQGRPVWGRLDQPLEAADRLVVVTVEDDDAERRLCQVCRVEPCDNGFEAGVARRLAERPAADWEVLLGDAGIPVAPVCTDLSGLPADPRLARLFEVLSGPCRAPAAPWTLSSGTGVGARPPDLAAAAGPWP